MKDIEELDMFDVIVIPYPYTDNLSLSKRRPAVVLSGHDFFNRSMQQVVCAMITKRKTQGDKIRDDWPGDVVIDDLDAAGLPVPSKIRMKIFTLDKRFILRKTGKLGQKDQKTLRFTLKKLLSL